MIGTQQVISDKWLHLVRLFKKNGIGVIGEIYRGSIAGMLTTAISNFLLSIADRMI